jgi:endoglucanase
MLCAHIDEIGMIVHHIDGAFLRVSRLGGIDARTIAGQPVIVHCDPPLRGVVGAAPWHTLADDQHGHYAPLTELVVDVGLSVEEVQQRIPVGTAITLDTALIDLGAQRVTGKALDDRACVAAITACLDALQSRRHSWDVLAVASVQEEVGGYGAMTEAYRLNPDLAIALDVTFADQPGANHATFALNGAPPIGLGANFHPVLYKALCAAGERIEMGLRRDPLPMQTGTDAWPIQISQDGIPTALIQIPLRNMHSVVEMVDMRDIVRTGRLLAEFISGLDNNFLSTVVWETAAETEEPTA